MKIKHNSNNRTTQHNRVPTYSGRLGLLLVWFYLLHASFWPLGFPSLIQGLPKSLWYWSNIKTSADFISLELVNEHYLSRHTSFKTLFWENFREKEFSNQDRLNHKVLLIYDHIFLGVSCFYDVVVGALMSILILVCYYYQNIHLILFFFLLIILLILSSSDDP